MAYLEKKDLFSLEKYSEIRIAFRDKIIQHKKNRRLSLNPHATLYFEDTLTCLLYTSPSPRDRG